MDVESYEAAGRHVRVPRRACPACGGPLIFWSGYRRYVRSRGCVRRIWIRRSRCRRCARSHALIPSFLLIRRFDPAAVIGAALVRSVSGSGLRTVAAVVGVPHTTARDWRWRFRARAPVLAAGFASLAVALGGSALELPADLEAAALQALSGAWGRARVRFGAAMPGPFGFASVVSGGALLATNTTPPWAVLLGGRWMPPVPTNDGRKPPDAH